jgi:hypothetical protein
MHARRAVGAGVLVAALAVTAQPANAAAPGWSTPHTVTPYRYGGYAVAPGPKGVQIFGNGAVQTMIPRLRAIKTDATEGTAVSVNPGAPGFAGWQLSVNDDARFVAAWMLDNQGTGPIGLAATLGSRTSLPRSAAVLPTDGQDVSGVATAIDDDGNGVVAWFQQPRTPGPTTFKAATLRPGQPPQVVTVATRANADFDSLSVGLDDQARPTITWTVLPLPEGPDLIAVARTNAAGAFSTFEQQLAPGDFGLVQTSVTENGTVLAIWSEQASANSPVTVKTAEAAPGATFGAARTLVGSVPGGGPIVADANAAGRAAVFFGIPVSGGMSLRVLLRTASGNWGSIRPLGPSGRSVAGINIGVDASGRAVALWADGPSGSSNATRILAARSSSASNPLSSYNQVSQRSGDKRCAEPTLFLSTSGDGLGLWNCFTTSTGGSDSPRLARLTKPS